MDIPKNIRIDKLPGPKRGIHPTLYFQDEIVWSANRNHFALAYSITEASICNDVGCILWAEVKNGKANIIQNPKGVLASCWQSPWCRWLSDDIFIYKSQRYNGKSTCIPVVAIHILHGFQVIEGTNSAEKWLDDIPNIENNWIKFKTKKMFKIIKKITY